VNRPLAHVAVPAIAEAAGPALPGQICDRCHQQVKPPHHEGDVPSPVCWTCRVRPCEGRTAFCHECQCSGAVVRYRGMCRCGATWTGERTCHCSACHLTFTSVGPFDAHRRGRCLSEAELRAKGYEPNEHGHWRKPAPEGTFQGRKHDGA
jgi:hypothetical protein